MKTTAVVPDTLPIYLIPGMTAEYPVFSRLVPLLPNAILSEFIAPEPDESIIHYASRMAGQFTPQSYIAGVSFGGIIALEISRILRPRGCILISSVRYPRQMPPWFRMWRTFGSRHCSRFLHLAGAAAALVPRSVSTSSTLRATKLSGAGGAWHRWATSAVIGWQPSSEPIGCPVLQIHGNADTTFPIRFVRPEVAVQGGQHALPVSHPNETANAIRAFTEAP